MTKPLATALSEVRNRDRRIAKLEKQFSALQAENAKLQAALRTSTELLRTMHVTGGVTVSGILNQIAANEAALRSKYDTDQK